MPLRNLPIRRKLMLILLLTSAVVMLLVSGTLLAFEYVSFRRTTVRQVATLGEVLSANSTAALAFDNPEDAAEILSSLRAQRGVVAAALYDQQGRLFARYPGDVAVAALPSAPGGAEFGFSGTRLSGFLPVLQQDRRLGALYLEFDEGGVMRDWFARSAAIALVVMAVVFLVAYWLSQILQRQISGPILALAETSRAVSEHNDYSVRAETSGGGELRLLTEAFNQMLVQIERLNRDLEQRVLERTAQLESANRELESFSYSVSHDLRAPLRHIDGFAHLLAERLEPVLDDTARRHLATITGSAKRLGVLIDELLVFSRMGRTELHKVDTNSRALIDDVVRELQPETQHRRVEWTIGDLPLTRADPVMLRQVWSNLLGNAAKYTRQRDPARIDVTHRLDEARGHVFSVRDNGAGFQMEYAAKLFGVFQRLHSEKEFEGTGIGLANVRRIVERHGGRTWAEGRPGEGATFFFSLPLEMPALAGHFQPE